MKFDPSKEIDDVQASLIIRNIINFGNIMYSKHVEKQMKARNYTTNDVIYILENGKIVSKEYRDDFQNWVYKITGQDLEGEDGGVVTAILTKNDIVIITVLS